MTSADGGEESQDCGRFSLQTAVTSVGRRVTTVGRRCTGWLSVRIGRLRDAVERARKDRGLGLGDGRWREVADRLVEAARPAVGRCRRLVGRRVADACASCRPGTARLRQSLGFWRAVLAEFVGTFFLVVVGCGAATEQAPYSPTQQQQQDRAVRMALAFGMHIHTRTLHSFNCLAFVATLPCGIMSGTFLTYIGQPLCKLFAPWFISFPRRQRSRGGGGLRFYRRLSVCLFFRIYLKTMHLCAAILRNLTPKCSVMSPETPFTLESKGHKSQKHCRCDCWLLLVRNKMFTYNGNIDQRIIVLQFDYVNYAAACKRL